VSNVQESGFLRVVAKAVAELAVILGAEGSRPGVVPGKKITTTTRFSAQRITP